MPVTGNEETEVFSWSLLNISPGIPLKKRRLLLIPPPSPPPQESQSSPCKETNDVKKIEESCSDLKKEESVSDLKIPEQSCTDIKSTEESVPPVKKEGEDGSEGMNCEGSGSELVDRRAALDLKIKHVTDPDKKLLSGDAPENSSGMPEVGLLCNLEGKKKLLSTEKAASKEALLNNDMVQKSEGSPPDHGKSDSSLLSLSLTKGMPVTEQKNTDTDLGNDNNDLSTNRFSWDLNMIMDSWDGSAGDAKAPASNNASCSTSNQNEILQFFNSTDPECTSNNKGKQLMGTDEHVPRPSGCLIASVRGNHGPEDSLRLTLGVSSQEMEVGSGLSAELACRKALLTSSLPDAAISTADMDSSSCGIVKSEPIEDNSKITRVASTSCPVGLVTSSSVKREHIERGVAESASFSVGIPEKLSEQKTVKEELVMDVGHGSTRVDDVALRGFLKGKRLENCGSSSGLPMPLSPQNSAPSRVATSSELFTSVEISKQSEYLFHANETQASRSNTVQTAAVVHEPIQKCREAKMSGHDIVTLKTDAKISNNLGSRQSKVGKTYPDLRINGEGSASEDEKINIPAETMEYEYGSDCESDGNRHVSVPLETGSIFAREDDDFEDGEVREALVHLPVGDDNAEIVGKKSVKRVNSDGNLSVSIDHGMGSNRICHGMGSNRKDDKSVSRDDKTVDIQEHVDKVSIEVDGQSSKKQSTLPKLSADASALVAANDKLLVAPSQRKLRDQSGGEFVLDGEGKGIACDELTSSCDRIVETMVEATDENAHSAGMGDMHHSSLSKVDAIVKQDGVCKESTSGGSKSRIINLPRSSATSTFETKPFQGSSFPSKSGREREEIEMDGRSGFVRHRIQEQPFRNSRMTYMRGRGRLSGHVDNLQGECDVERDLPGKNSADPCRVNRQKRSTAYNDLEVEPRKYGNAPSGTNLNISRERKPVKDLPSFRHSFPRRLSPGSRDGPPTMNVQMLHKVQRNASPGRHDSGGVHGADFVGFRHDEKFAGGLHDDVIESSYSRPNSGYEGTDVQFVRGTRDFSRGQRRFFPRVRSKSPVGSRARSPGSWSPRKRSPDRFKGPPKISQRRPAAMYGADRMRSPPDRPCFPEPVVARRRGSPSYVGRPSNNKMDVESGNEHVHPRPFNSRRSPSDRVFGRSPRRFDVLEPRFREGDEFFGRPHSDGFHEFNGEGSGDERRKYGERRGFHRSFRSSYSGDSDNVRFHGNDGPRSFRFYHDGDTEYAGRNMGDREFEGRIKNRPAAAPRRPNY